MLITIRILHVTKKGRAAAAQAEGQHEPVRFQSLEPNNWKKHADMFKGKCWFVLIYILVGFV